jgi:hypothetical protein
MKAFTFYYSVNRMIGYFIIYYTTGPTVIKNKTPHFPCFRISYPFNNDFRKSFIVFNDYIVDNDNVFTQVLDFDAIGINFYQIIKTVFTGVNGVE